MRSIEIVFIRSILLHVLATAILREVSLKMTAAETCRRVLHIKTTSAHFVSSIIVFYTYSINAWIMDHVKEIEDKMETY
jgi:hypothetical protein